jgi:hypothetical protein
LVILKYYMPIQKRIRWGIPPSDRVLRPLVGRPLTIGRVVELVDQLVILEEISIEPNMAEERPNFPRRPNPPPPPPIDPMLLPRGLLIVVSQIPQIAIPANLPRFFGSRNEDPVAHVERFEELLISSLVTQREYYLIWFPTTLTDSAYSWYRSHNAGTFTTYAQLLAAFLNQYRPETGQQQALSALISTKQGSTEDITSYVGTLLNDQTICYYFIQGFDINTTRWEVLTRQPNTLEAAIQATIEVEVIDKENDRMERRFDDPIPTFIPLSHQPSEPLLNHHTTEDYHPSMAYARVVTRTFSDGRTIGRWPRGRP